MRCVLCAKLSLAPLCKSCKAHIKPRVNERKLSNDFTVFSFFAYDDIAPLIYSKHQAVGVYIYSFLSSISFRPFLQKLDNDIFNIVPIDDKPKGGYSHTAVLANSIKLSHIKTNFGSLRAKNRVSYSGKSKKFRKNNPRDFRLKLTTKQNIILLDDVVTTGTTLLEAKKCLENWDISPIFALTLADANVK